MGYLDVTNAEILALTRERRRELIRARLAARPPTLRFYAAGPTPEYRCTGWTTNKQRLSIGRLDKTSQPPTRCQDGNPARRREPMRRYVKPPSSLHGAVPESVFRTLWSIQRGRCYMCAKGFVAEDWATQDHVVPRSKGGGSVLLACFACNNDKGDRDPKPCELLYLEAAGLRFLGVFAQIERELLSTETT